MKESSMPQKRPRFTVADLVIALLCFGGFLIVGLWAYYTTVGEFVSAQLAGVYTILALVGALSMLLRLRWFSLLYYLGCALGWAAGGFVAGLKGDFAPTAGLIVTFFLIAVFALFGAIAQWRSWKRRSLRRREEKERERLREEQAQKARETAAAGLEAQQAETPVSAPTEDKTV